MDFLGLSIYLTIAIICFVFLFMIVFLGDFMDFDAHADLDLAIDSDFGDFGGPGVTPLSLPIVLSFGMGFGTFGTIIEAYDIMDARFVPLAAAFLGSLFAGGIFIFFSKFLLASQATTKVTKADLMGQVCKVRVPIEPGEVGQVLVITKARGRTLRDAVANEAIPKDASVKIISLEGTTVRVEKFGE